jgi:uncharacterized Zn-binding protein involved in type VI secretion
MKHLNLLLAFATLATTSCADTPASPEAAAQLAQAGGRDTRPLQGSCETTYQVIGATSTSITLLIDGVCRISHLGRTTTTGVQVVDFASGTIRVEHGEYVAANGDRLFFSHDGYLGAPSAGGSPTFAGTHIFHGGTGRFADARGEAAFTGGASMPDMTGQGTGHLQLRGWIDY